MRNYSPFLFFLIFSFIIGANIGCSQNKKDPSLKDSPSTQNKINDSSNNQDGMGRNMMGRGMMNGAMGSGMMGNGMMSGQTGNNSSQQGGKWIAPASASKVKNPVAGIAAATKEGQELFNSQCVICHGPEGLGNGVAGASLSPHPANLTADSVQDQTDGAIYWKITTGNPPMASYKNVFSDRQRWDLVNYIRKLGKK